MKKEFLKSTLAALLFLVFLAPTAQAKITVLTYSSLLDKGGLGEDIKKIAADKGIQVEFSSSKDFSGMLGTLRRLKRDLKLSSIDVVLGLNESNYKTALKEGLIEEGAPFEEATYSILVNTENFPKKNWPKNWNEVKTKLAGKLLIQDPRTSEVGLAWLLNATSLSNLTLAEAKSLPKKVFPTWSSSFKAFESDLAPAVWTYSTSAAYYRCTDDAKAKNYENLPLPFYPKDKNFVSVGAKKEGSKEAKAFIKLVLSKEIQSEIWQKNWM